MSKVKIPAYDAYKYREVFRILEWSGGAIYKTLPTGKFIKTEDENKLDKTEYTTTSISTTLMRQPEIELELFQL